MRVLCVLVVCFLGLSWAMPQRYYAVPSQVDDDDDADVEDAPYDNDDAGFDDMFTFPTGGPGGPPRNKFLESPRQARTDNQNQLVSYPGTYYFSYDSDPTTLYPGNPLEDGFMESEDESPQYARQLARKEEEAKASEAEDEQEDEEEEEDEEEDDDPDSDDEPSYAVPDMNKLFPNPEGRPRGPGDYNAYLKHSGGKQQPQQQGSPSRRYRYVEPEYYNEINALTDQYDTVVIEADGERSRRIEAQAPAPAEQEDEEDEEEDDADQEDEGDADDDVDFSVPSYEKLFPNPDNKQVANSNLYSGMKNSWNNAPRPPGGRYARVIRLFQSPLHHDTYNPDYVIDPTIAMNRRNERLRYRYSSPHWRRQNIKTPYNYKPILYQQGHWGNPREHDYNPVSGHHYLGGIYNGNTYY